ncbi:MAG: SRPBCC family protein [Gemmatimonadales bacterium]
MRTLKTRGQSTRAARPTPKPITFVVLRHHERWPRGLGAAVLALVLAAAFYASVARPWNQTWGATSAEVARYIPGDSLVADPQQVTTRAITIRAEPSDIWPWLAQMGRGRGGLYSYDFLDRWFGVLDQPSADTVLPAFQRLQAGDTIRVGGSAGWPVEIAQPDRLLLIHVRESGVHVTWAFVLDPVARGETRLVMRVRARLPWHFSTAFILAALDPAEFLMMRRQLLGIRERSERLAASRGGPAPRFP